MEQRGEAIPGSHLFRDFCTVCGEAIRVSEEKRALPRNYCLDCMRKAVHKLAETVQRQSGQAVTPEDDDADYDFDSYDAGRGFTDPEE